MKTSQPEHAGLARQMALPPQAAAQRQSAATPLEDEIDASPRMAAQRRQLAAAFGSAVASRVEAAEEEDEEPAQAASASPQAAAVQAKAAGQGGLPPSLRAGMESISGMDLSDVKVHTNSGQPAELGAHAYAQGSDIHLAPGQEQHLAHEAWHVVQQRQGRVAATIEVGGVGVNDDPSLEQEADRMGAQALQAPASSADAMPAQRRALSASRGTSAPIVQRRELYGQALLTTGYFDHVPAARAAEFARVLAGIQPVLPPLRGMRSRLNEFLLALGLPARADNPITAKIGELTALCTLLQQNPTQSRWQEVNAAETALGTIETDALATASFDSEKVRIRAALRKMRVDTFGTQEYLLTQLGDNEDWLNPAQTAAAATVRRLQARVNEMMELVGTATDFTDLEFIPDALVRCEGEAAAVAAVPFAAAMEADGWDNVEAEPATPRDADLFFQAHIIDRHSMSSTAAGAGKFNTDNWGTIRARIRTALENGDMVGPVFNDVDGRPQGRYEFTHDSGAPMGRTIGGAATNRIFAVVTRSGKTVVTAYPV